MTQDLLDELKENSNQRLLHEAQAKALTERNIEIRANCDHRYADGTSAWKECWCYDMCDICSALY